MTSVSKRKQQLPCDKVLGIQELFELIVLHMDFEDPAYPRLLATVCRRWYSYFAIYFWKRVVVHTWDTRTTTHLQLHGSAIRELSCRRVDRSILKLVCHFCTNLQTLHLSLDERSIMVSYDLLELTFLRTQTHLATVSIKIDASVISLSILWALSRLPHLTHLSLQVYGTVDLAALVAETLGCCPGLQSLTLELWIPNTSRPLLKMLKANIKRKVASKINRSPRTVQEAVERNGLAPTKLVGSLWRSQEDFETDPVHGASASRFLINLSQEHLRSPWHALKDTLVHLDMHTTIIATKEITRTFFRRLQDLPKLRALCVSTRHIVDWVHPSYRAPRLEWKGDLPVAQCFGIDDNIEGNHLRKLPAVSYSFTSLREFVVKSYPFGRGLYMDITSDRALFAIAAMPSLEYFVAEEGAISQGTLDELKEKFPKHFFMPYVWKSLMIGTVARKGRIILRKKTGMLVRRLSITCVTRQLVKMIPKFFPHTNYLSLVFGFGSDEIGYCHLQRLFIQLQDVLTNVQISLDMSINDTSLLWSLSSLPYLKHLDLKVLYPTLYPGAHATDKSVREFWNAVRGWSRWSLSLWEGFRTCIRYLFINM
ncbi:hypothetical protein BGZ96_009487 [Linnemannia gamsii]|uniref:F-box domain-containing protein n=1 Tax=Linnemannia gamsii TaxID=64522 RepID=A0ABQ7JWZ8_9FUNG|nr:hypothetical protein BGZ96_009487 [Linnemannia gamsii]